jgi:transcriptional regulator with XRE-family HTH domain
MSQQALADFSGLNVARLEDGRFKPSRATLQELAAILGADLSMLCRLAEVPTPDQWISSRLTREVLTREYVEGGKSAPAVAAQFEVSTATVQKYVRRHGLPSHPLGQHRRKFRAVDPVPFVGPASEWHAYWLGFFAADGCVWADYGGPLLRLRLKADDADHLHGFVKGVGSDTPVKEFRTTQGRRVAQVEFSGRPLVEVLCRWGIGPRKTLTVPFPRQLSGSFRAAFIRGYFDGDGSIYWRQRGGHRAAQCKFTSGSRDMIVGLRDALTEEGVVLGPVQAGTGRALVLPVLTAKPNLRRFAEYLYDGATAYLPRKRAVFQELGVLA